MSKNATNYRLAVTLFALLTCSCTSKPETLIDSGYDEQEMEAAITTARREVSGFVAELRNPTGTNHAVKVPIQDAGKTEHFWLIDVSHKDGRFDGTINNDPGIVKNVKIGDKRSVAQHEISDWMFMRGGKMYGNYTMRPLLKAMPEDEAAKYRSLMAEP
jgi:uncharacterized protein YegJ (DUF2314 family)